MSIAVEVHNLGPLKSAEIELSDLNVLVGDNNTGKTFFGTVLHRTLASSDSYPLPRRAEIGNIPKPFGTLVENLIRALGSKNPSDEWITWKPDPATRRWINTVNRKILTGFGSAVRDAIAYAYGTEASSLRRRTMSRSAPDSFVRIAHSSKKSEVEWEVRIPFDSDTVHVATPDSVGWLAHLLGEENVEFATGLWPMQKEDVDSAVADLENTCWRLALLEGREALFDGWPRDAIHLPSERSGIVQNYRLLSGAAARSLASADDRRADKSLLSGTEADLLTLLLSAKHSEKDGRSSAKFSRFVHDFEEDIGAGIDIEDHDSPTQSIVAATPEGRFPISRASAMLSELAALHLALRFHLEPGDSLTIDEPEAHLHPAAQRRMASFLVQLVLENATVILTTHSDFFVGQLNNHIRASELTRLETPPSDTTSPAIDRSRVRAMRFSRSSRWCTGEAIDIDPVDGIDEATFTDEMDALYGESTKTTNPLLDTAID